ncbi:MAG: efflux RND transporter periplasmic adaptor subunit [Gammaproteobacteria bacterium]|nr:efflux RND transporter periplasmic adaptor subunit [Gammaproteobacteria bacterium]
MNDQNLLEQLRLDPDQRDGRGTAKRRYRLVAGVLLLAALGGGAALMLGPRPVAVATVTAQAPAALAGGVAVLDATGYVTARREATVSFKITGKLADVLIEEGDAVTQDQVLARLDDVDERTQLQLAQARLGAVRAQLGQVEAEADQAARDLRRQQELNARGLTPQQALEDARTRAASLAAQLAAQRGQVEVARAELQVAQVNLDNTVIRAPFAGVVVAVSAQPGEIVSPISAGGGFTRTGIATIVDMDSLEIEVDVNEAFINRVRPGQPVAAALDAYPDWRIPARVIAIIPTADRSKATVKVRIALEEKDARIVPDMGARVSFLQEDTADAVPDGALVPAAAIARRDGASVVFVLDGDRVRRREIEPGQTYGDMVLVGEGIDVGQVLVRDPPPSLTDGARVEVGPGA